MGGYWRRKGMFDLIEAVALVVPQVPAVELVLIGFPDEGERKDAEALWKERGLNDRVKMLGWVDDKVKREKLETAGVFVLPSYNEGMPMGVLEAMASGVPVVATTVGGIPEQIEDGKTGFLVRPGDCEALADRITTIFNSRERAAAMGMEARQRAREYFDLGVVSRKVAALYREQLDLKNRR